MADLIDVQMTSAVEDAPGWVEVLVDCPGAQGVFTYQLPANLRVQPGDILSVPFGAQQVGAIALQLLAHPSPDLDPSQLRCVEAVVSASFFPPTYWALLHQVAHYYATPLMAVIRVALPPGLLARSQRRIRLVEGQNTDQITGKNSVPIGTRPKSSQPLEPSHPEPRKTHAKGNPATQLAMLPEIEDGATQAAATLTPTAQKLLKFLQASKTGDYAWKFIQQKVKGAPRGLPELIQQGWVESYLEPPATVRPKLRQAVTLVGMPAAPELTDRQRELLEILKRQGGDLWLSDFLQLSRTTTPTLKTLERLGYLVIQPREVLRSEAHPAISPASEPALTADQAIALDRIQTLTGWTEVLLHGVTGSGKTEIYLQAIAPLLQQGKSALVLVPEIGLTPQLTDRFRARFGDRVWVYHSALSDGERYDTWRQLLTGGPQVVIGTRSAIFLPLPHLGLIVLDEEHDSSFKQDQPAPCYHTRTVAQWRAQLVNCPLILGSATPSLESWLMAHYPKDEATNQYLSLPRRIYDRPLPPIDVVDMRQELKQGNTSIFSRSLQTALRQMHQQGQQGLLFIHRRGHSTFVSCRNCGYVMECPHCDVSLSYHHTHAEAQPLLRCHYCNFGQLQPSHCPACGSSYFKNFGSGTQRVTQELANQFPELRVIRFDSDTTRAKGSHRALLTQFGQGDADLLVGTQMLTKGLDLPQVTLVGIVAADGLLNLADFRASERAFQTLVQVAGRAGRGADPGRVILQTYTPDHAVIDAVRHQTYAPFARAELQQRQMLAYPPYGRLILLRLSSPNAVAVQSAAQRVAQTLTQPDSLYSVIGPAPATILRVANRYRWQILLKFPPDTALPPIDWDILRSLCGATVSLTIDIDPLNVM
jgi:primosomal protein N' (replication factor Y) (superfamily II helicase)